VICSTVCAKAKALNAQAPKMSSAAAAAGPAGAATRSRAESVSSGEMQLHALHALMDIHPVREEHQLHAKHLNDLWSTGRRVVSTQLRQRRWEKYTKFMLIASVFAQNLR